MNALYIAYEAEDFREAIARAADSMVILAMHMGATRYATLTSGQVLRNKSKKPLLHNGKVPR